MAGAGQNPKKSVSLRDVARAAHVSLSAASAALSGRIHVHPETRERVRAAARRLGYSPDVFARSLRGIRPPFLAVIGYMRSWPNQQILQGMLDSLTDKEQLLFVLPEGDLSPAQAETRLRFLLNNNLLSGLVVLHGRGVPNETVVGVLGAGVPVVTVERRFPGAHSILVDNPAGGRLAAQYLLPRSSKILMVTPRGRPDWAKDREQGFLATLASEGHRPSRVRRSVSRFFTPEEGLRLAGNLPVTARSRTGIFCLSGDPVAAGLLAGLLRRGLQPLRDFLLLGYDDLSLAQPGIAGLTTVKQPFSEMGQRAVQILLNDPRFRSSEPQHLVFQPSLVLRRTA